MPAGLDVDKIGPVDVAVILFEGNKFNGDVAPALAELNGNGTVRIIDLAFVRKDIDGTTVVVEADDAEVAGAFERVYDTQFDLLSDEDLDEITDELEPGSSALVIVWENTWAARISAAIRDSHGQMISEDRIPRQNVLRAIADLERTEEYDGE
ncbi:MAG TPA: DUF6325 family protein [Trebonia sp.]